MNDTKYILCVPAFAATVIRPDGAMVQDNFVTQQEAQTWLDKNSTEKDITVLKAASKTCPNCGTKTDVFVIAVATSRRFCESCGGNKGERLDLTPEDIGFLHEVGVDPGRWFWRP